MNAVLLFVTPQSSCDICSIALFPPTVESIIQLKQHQNKINNISIKFSDNQTVNVQNKQNVYMKHKYRHSFTPTSHYSFGHSFTHPMINAFNKVIFEYNTTVNQYTAINLFC